MSKLKMPSFSTSTVKLFDFSGGMSGEVDGKIATPTIADVSYNFSLKDGALKDGIGVKEFSVEGQNGKSIPKMPSGVLPLKSYFYKRYDETNECTDDRLLIFADDGAIYECKLSCGGEMKKVDGLQFESVPTAATYKYNGDDVIILSNDKSFKIYDGEKVSDVEGVPSITSMCVHSERLFVTTGGEQTSLWFSDDFDPANWFVSLDEAGFIDFQDVRGRLLKAVSFNGYVYIFRNYGITRLTAYGDQTEFYATGLFLGSGRIYKNAIIECGNRIIYLAENGFYSFDGLYATRILKDYDEFLRGVDNSDAIGKFFNGRLYVALKMKFDKQVERAVLVFDLSTGLSYVARGLRVRDIEIACANDYSALILLLDGKNKIGELSSDARVFGEPLEKLWRSHFSDFGIDGQKSLAKISLYTAKDLIVKVTSDLSEKTFLIGGKSSSQTFQVGLKGNTFSISFSSSGSGDAVGKIRLYFNYF